MKKIKTKNEKQDEENEKQITRRKKIKNTQTKKNKKKKKQNKTKKPRKNNSDRVQTSVASWLFAHLLNCLLNGIDLCPRCYFVQIKPISQKFKWCETDGRTDRASYRDARMHLSRKR